MFKRFAIALAGLVLAAAPLATISPASAVIGTCDPATRGMAYNEMDQVEGGVDVYARYGWDGTSTRDTGCDGPVLLLRGTNVSTTDTWYVHFQGRKGQWILVTLTPGQVLQVTSSGQLRQMGLSNRSDLDGLYITQDPTPPQVV